LVAGNFSQAVLAILSHVFPASSLVVVQASFPTTGSRHPTQSASFVVKIPFDPPVAGVAIDLGISSKFMQNDPQLFSIGEFSQISGLSVKALRFYDEKGLLKPAHVDPANDYRYYDVTSVERARIIARLRELQFPLHDIARILSECSDEADLLGAMQRQQRIISERMRTDARVVKALERMIAQEIAAARVIESGRFAVQERSLDSVVMAGLRMKGRYEDCGRGFSTVARMMGRHLSGRPFCLYYDGEHREEDASFETCFPLRREVPSRDDVVVRVLPPQRCLSLVHQGPYPQLGRSYRKLLVEARRREFTVQLPTREVYLKGPGMIFKGNPARYLTEIQLPIKES
jgi:DNA-binding transcriptional MerR regulator/effector-binding domain-containing protein